MAFTPNININVTDYTGNEVLSSYTTPLTPFAISVDTSELISASATPTQLYWDLGDGTEVVNTNYINHWFHTPGVYEVKLYLFSSINGEGSLNGTTLSLSAYDYIPSTITVDTRDDTQTDIDNTILTRAGKLENPILLRSFKSWQHINDNTSIHMHVSGSNSPYFGEQKRDSKWSHLLPFARFAYYELNSNREEVLTISETYIPTEVPIYLIKDTGNILKTTTQPVPESFIVGLSAEKDIFYVDDTVSNGPINVFFNYNINDVNVLDPNNDNKLYSFHNIIPQTLVYSITSNEPSHLKISSNGLDSNGTLNSFDIFPVKFASTYISFTITIKDISNNTLFLGPPIDDYQIILVDSSTLDPISATFFDTTMSVLSGNDISRSSVVVGHFITETTTDACFLSAVCIYNSITLTGVSNEFEISSTEGKYKITKRNENINMSKQIQTYLTSPILQDSPTLFDEYIPAIFGTLTDANDIPGKVLYEKISNFVRNTKSIDKCNIDNLIDILDILQLQAYERDVVIPSELQRLIDLFSIKRSHLFVSNNQYNIDFDKRGTQNPSIGRNLGQRIVDPLNYVLTQEHPIVVQDNFSSKFLVVNKYVVPVTIYIDDPVNTLFALSSYTPEWGWGLPVNDDTSVSDIFKLFTFYEYNNTSLNNQIGGEVVLNNTVTTLPVSSYSSDEEWFSVNGPVIHTILHKLVSKTGCFVNGT